MNQLCKPESYIQIEKLLNGIQRKGKSPIQCSPKWTSSTFGTRLENRLDALKGKRLLAGKAIHLWMSLWTEKDTREPCYHSICCPLSSYS